MHRVDEAHIVGSLSNGVYSYGNACLIDRSCAKRLPIGDSSFEWAVAHSVVIDKTMLIADILDSGYKAMLFCRPRRFGKTFNMSMLKSFLRSDQAKAPLVAPSLRELIFGKRRMERIAFIMKPIPSSRSACVLLKAWTGMPLLGQSVAR